MFWLGMILASVGGLWLAINAFRAGNTLWGIGALLLPFVAQIYGFLNLDDNKVPLLLSGIGIVLLFMGYGDYVAQVEALQGAAEAAP